MLSRPSESGHYGLPERGAPGPSPTAGSVNVKRALALLAGMRPPCASTSPFEIASPSPVPPPRGRRARETSARAFQEGCRLPSSEIEIVKWAPSRAASP